jgi:hypothetical protein
MSRTSKKARRRLRRYELAVGILRGGVFDAWHAARAYQHLIGHPHETTATVDAAGTEIITVRARR